MTGFAKKGKYQGYSYPEDINQPRYKNRRCKFVIKEPRAFGDPRGAYAASKDKLMDLYNTIPSPSSSLVEIISNLNANSKTSTGKTIGSITLPLPNTFSDSQNHGWTMETGIIGGAGREMMKMTAGDIVGAIPGASKGTAQLADKITGKASLDKMLGSIANQTGSRKPLIDPGYFQNYTGSEPRTFNMSFDLVPKNADEANEILMIILKLKEWSSPSKLVGGVALTAPHWFDIQLSNTYISALAKIDRVVLSAINVDYGADGAMQQTADGMPKFMALSMVFQEADMTTANDYNSRQRK